MSPPSPGFRPELRRDGTWRCPTVYLSYESNFRPLECQWSLSSLSESLCGFIMAWLVSLTWNLNKVELEVPSFLPVNLTRPAETINADHNPSGSDPSRPTAVFKLGASLPVPGEVSVGPPGHRSSYRDSSTHRRAVQASH